MPRNHHPPKSSPAPAKPLKPHESLSPFDVLDATFVAEARDASQMVEGQLPEIAFAGRSNVGKSTLLNRVSQRKALARVSRTPGCTRGVVMFDVKLRDGRELRIVDLPGYGFAQRSKSERKAWGPLIESYLLNRTALRGVMILVDARRGPEFEERDLAEFLAAGGIPYALVATKIDKMSRSERGLALDAIARENKVRVLGVSGETGEGREKLMRAVTTLAFPREPFEQVDATFET